MMTDPHTAALVMIATMVVAAAFCLALYLRMSAAERRLDTCELVQGEQGKRIAGLTRVSITRLERVERQVDAVQSALIGRPPP